MANLSFDTIIYLGEDEEETEVCVEANAFKTSYDSEPEWIDADIETVTRYSDNKDVTSELTDEQIQDLRYQATQEGDF